jgi:hypothetical protein
MEIYIISIRSEIETAKAPWWACPADYRVHQRIVIIPSRKGVNHFVTRRTAIARVAATA